METGPETGRVVTRAALQGGPLHFRDNTPRVPGDPCLRCGDFLDDAKRAVPGLSFCRDCLDEKPPEATLAASLKPPPEVHRGLGLTVLVFTVVFLALGSAIWFTVDVIPVQGPADRFFLPVAAALLGALVGAAFFMRVLMKRNFPLWAASILAKHGVQGLGPGLPFVQSRDWPSDHMRRIDLGPLVEGEGGFAFLGTRGTRSAIRFSDVASVAVGPDDPREWPLLRAALRLELRDGTFRSFMSLHAPRRAWAQDAAARVRARLAERL